MSTLPTAAAVQPRSSFSTTSTPQKSPAATAIASSTTAAAAPSAKTLLLHWEEGSALHATQNSALAQLNVLLTERQQQASSRQQSSSVAEKQREAVEEKGKRDADNAPVESDSRLQSLLRQQRSVAASKRAQSKAEVRDLSHVDTSLAYPFAAASTSAQATPSSSQPSLAAIYSLLLNAQFYTQTPEYIEHMTKEEAAAGAQSLLAEIHHFRVEDPTVNAKEKAARHASHQAHIEYYLQLRSTSLFLKRLLDSTQTLAASSQDLLQYFTRVFSSTNSVREECSALLVEQQTLASATFKFNYHLSYFVEADELQRKLNDASGVEGGLGRFMRENSDAHAFNSAATSPSGAGSTATVGTSGGGMQSVDPLSANPMNSPEFPHLLTSLDNCISYMTSNSDFLDSPAYRVRYEKIHAGVLRAVRNFVEKSIERAIKMAREQAAQLAPLPPAAGTDALQHRGLYQSHPTWMRIFVQLRSVAQALKPLMGEMEHRALGGGGGDEAISSDSTSPSSPALQQPAVYKELLLDCYRIYSSRRHTLLYTDLDTHLATLSRSGRPLSEILRSACTSWIDLCTMESQLYWEFFAVHDASIHALNTLLSSFCSLLYTRLRPPIISSGEMDLLAECLGILREEVVEEQRRARGRKGVAGVDATSGASSGSSSSTTEDLFHPSSPLYSFSKSIQRLIADVQERLIYRAQTYVRETIQKYQHTKADLDYPAKLLKPADASTPSAAAQEDPASMMPSSSAPTSREQLFASWHPALERTLMCLSKLFRCVEVSVFKYLAQEAVSVCTAVLIDASAKITTAHASSDPSHSDGLLFLIKHLLILRDQIAPFSSVVDLSTTSHDLDFSHMKDVLPNIFSSVGKWSSFLDLVQTSAPRLKESKMDAKKVSQP
jgi:hypothetical protein